MPSVTCRRSRSLLRVTRLLKLFGTLKYAYCMCVKLISPRDLMVISSTTTPLLGGYSMTRDVGDRWGKKVTQNLQNTFSNLFLR